MKYRFDPINGDSYQIIKAVMASPEVEPYPDLEFKLRLCVEEVAENIASYAYPQILGWAEVSTDIEGDDLIISFRDEGIPFNPLDKPDPDITLSAEERKIGGLGIFLCKQMMDELTYKFEDGCNILTMKIKVK